MGNFMKQKMQCMRNSPPPRRTCFKDAVWEFLMDHAVEDERYGYVIRIATVSRADFEKRVDARAKGYRSREELTDEDVVNFERIRIAKGVHKTHQSVDWWLRKGVRYRIAAYVRGRLTHWMNERRQEFIGEYDLGMFVSRKDLQKVIAADHGVEPRLSASKAPVLPLDESAMG